MLGDPMNRATFQANVDILFNLTNYPIFLLDKHFHIQCSPAMFLTVDADYFRHYQAQANEMIKKNQAFYMVYEHGYFYSFLYLPEKSTHYIWIGPILLDESKARDTMQSNGFFDRLHTSLNSEEILEKIPFIQENFSSLIQLICQNAFHFSISIAQLSASFRQEIQAQTQGRLQQLMSRKRELDNRSYNFSEEQRLLYYVRQGDAVSARIIATKLSKGRLGQLSKNGKRIPFYAFISLVTMISRTAMTCGVDIETAYGLNDLYIQKADEQSDIKQLQYLWVDMIVDFCLLIKQSSRNNYPTWVHQTMNYIALNLHQTITLDMIAKEVHMLASYVSVQFKKITDISLIHYIQHKKIEEAAFLLRSTTTSIQEISTLLAFSSQAYFSTIFKKQMGISPKSYRNSPNDIPTAHSKRTSS